MKIFMNSTAAFHGTTMRDIALAWSPVNRVSQALQIFATIGRSNVKLCVDFWHFWASGGLPDFFVPQQHHPVAEGFRLRQGETGLEIR